MRAKGLWIGILLITLVVGIGTAFFINSGSLPEQTFYGKGGFDYENITLTNSFNVFFQQSFVTSPGQNNIYAPSELITITQAVPYSVDFDRAVIVLSPDPYNQQFNSNGIPVYGMGDTYRTFDVGIKLSQQCTFLCKYELSFKAPSRLGKYQLQEYLYNGTDYFGAVDVWYEQSNSYHFDVLQKIQKEVTPPTTPPVNPPSECPNTGEIKEDGICHKPCLTGTKWNSKKCELINECPKGQSWDGSKCVGPQKTCTSPKVMVNGTCVSVRSCEEQNGVLIDGVCKFPKPCLPPITAYNAQSNSCPITQSGWIIGGVSTAMILLIILVIVMTRKRK